MKRILNIIIIILLSAICLTGTAQKIAVKSNLLGWATATPTLGAEIGLDDRWTLNTHIYYNPFTFRDNRKWKHIRVQPEVRYWLCQKFNGHFFGLHVLYTHFNAGQVPLPFGIFPDVKKYRYQGNTYGAGLSYGYQWILTPRWSIEGSIGVGYKYNTFKKLNIGSIKWINYIAVSSFAVYLIHNDLSIKPLYCAACDYIEAHYTPSFPYALLFMAGVFIVSVMADKVRLFIYKHTLLKLLK